MLDHPSITVMAFTSAPTPDRERGLVGWLSLRIGDLLLDGVTLRRTREGNLALSWPARRDRHGTDHPVVCPVDNAARRGIEALVMGALTSGSHISDKSYRTEGT